MNSQNSTNLKKRGFTLVELLVVIAIIGVLIALLLPAVQAAREAGRRTQCNNKLKQVALSVHNFHDTMNRFPCVEADPLVSNKRFTRGSWMFLLLPFMEQTQLYEGAMALAPTSGTKGLFTCPILGAKIDTFLCPSDGGWTWGVDETTADGAGNCPTNYRGSRGDLPTNAQGPTSTNLGCPRSWLTLGLTWGDGTSVTGGDLKGFEAVTDGTSNSLMLSEGIVYDKDLATAGGNYKNHLATNGVGHHQHKPQDCLSIKAGMMDGTQSSYYNPGAWQHNVGVRAFDPYLIAQSTFNAILPPNSPSCTDVTSATWSRSALMSASSNHPGGVQVAFLDGSGRFINDGIQTQNLNREGSPDQGAMFPGQSTTGGAFSYGVWAELGVINGGHTVDLNF